VELNDLKKIPGLIATVCTTGFVLPEFSQCREDMRSYNDRNGWHTMEYRFYDAKLVERGRDAACEHALKHNYHWILQIDADATFAPNAFEELMKTAFITHPQAHVVGAYAQLSAGINLPTIDTGTGRWEPHFPQQGVLPVIRTGGHFILVKTQILKAFGPPWFRTRSAQQPAQAFAEVDNFSRTKLDGRNPLVDHPEWNTLIAEAKRVGGDGNNVTVGEDSGSMDRVKAVGGNIVVNTDVITGHVAKKVITWKDLKKALDLIESNKYRAVGVLE